MELLQASGKRNNGAKFQLDPNLGIGEMTCTNLYQTDRQTCVILTVLRAVSAQTTDTPSNSSFLEALNSTNNSSSDVFSPDNDTLATEIIVTNGALATNVTDWATNWIENVTDSSLNQTTTTMLPTTVTSKTTLSSTTSTSTQAQTSSSIQEIVNTTLRTDSTTAKGGSTTLIGCIYWMVLSAVVLCVP